LEGNYKKGEFNRGELLNPGWVCVPEKELPVKLPKVKYYEPTGTGESPLAKIEKWVKTKCPKCGGPAKRETNTMPQWAGSCWYYLRYTDPKNKKELVSKKKEKYWMPVDLYVGGAEHATRHLIYARFWHKFLYDIGVVSTKEPFLRLKSVGLILGPDGRKMSKRYGNIINPDDICKKFGADSLRVYEMFMGPFDQEIAWQEKGVVGAKRFLERVWNLRLKIANCKLQIEKRKKVLKVLHQTIKKVTEDIENFKFNTAISQLMICANELEKEEKIEKEIFENFLKLLAPFAPHIAEEIWQILGHKRSIFLTPWPKWDKKLAKEEIITLIIQVNGKVRDKIEVEADISEERAKELAISSQKIKKWIEGKEIKRVVFVPRKLINIVV
jgi:leucyl-tRNA synthetase